MPNYLRYGAGSPYSGEELAQWASEENLTLEEYLKKHGFTPEESGNQSGSTGDPTTSQDITGSDLGDGSSESFLAINNLPNSLTGASLLSISLFKS